MLRTSIVLCTVALSAFATTSASAQARKFPVADIEAACVGRQTILRSDAVAFCGASAKEARKRYGSTVTNQEWFSASSVAGYKIRKSR
jgi:hypothetical protein